MTIKENAVSEAISVMLMISISVAAFGILAATFVTQVSIDEIPQADLVITQNNQVPPQLIILFERGEPLPYNDIQIKINDIDKKQSFYIKRYGENWHPVIWENYKVGGKTIPFSPGDSISYDNAPANARVTVTYNLSSGSKILYDVDLF